MAKRRPTRNRSEKRSKHYTKPSRPAPRVFKSKATLEKNRKGFGFLIFDGELEDAYVPPEVAQNYFYGDRVEVTATTAGEIIRIALIEHRFKELVGKVAGGMLVYDNRQAHETVRLSTQSELKAQEGDWIRAKIHYSANPKSIRPSTLAEVLEVYGKVRPASSDVALVAAEFNLTETPAPGAVEQATKFPVDSPEKELSNREDYRTIPFITIDGETARDFDDAIYVEKQNNHFVLWVAIADVSHYVTKGSAMDVDARMRGTSVYFPERAFHMLPRPLSEGLCSLRPNEARLALIAKMKIDATGSIKKTEIFEGVIESKRRATYTEIQNEYVHDQKNPNWEFTSHFELYHLLRKARIRRGSIDFDLPETQVLVDEKGEPTQILRHSRVDAHRLIEEFMIAANEAVTEWMMARKLPFIYRIHDEPSGESLEKFRRLALSLGYRFELGRNGEAPPPRALAEMVRQFEDSPAETLLNSALLRAMKQAVYSSEHGIHYGLASSGYTHFTSPIRRYPDLIVHRLLKAVLNRKLPPSKRAAESHGEREITEIAEHCSHRERLAADAERELIRLKQVRFLTRHLGDEFKARIVGMNERGMFAQVSDPFVEGLIPKESLSDDLYQFNEDRMIYYGVRKRRTFRIGEQAMIKVVRADIERRQADFALIDTLKAT